MMKVLGICASARKNGNTAIMMRKVFEALEKEGIETELVQFAGTVIEPSPQDAGTSRFLYRH